MRCLLLGLGFACVLGAQVPLHIVAVERKGLPPYEAADRIYRLDGGQNRGLRVGDRLLVKRSGEPRAIGHLRVVEVRGEQCEAHFEPSGSAYPMKGDLVLRAELKWPPVAGPLDVDPLPMTSPPAPSSEAPPQEGLLFFFPQQADLSPAGLKKLEAWVRAWGVGGRWAVQVPSAKALSTALQQRRAEALQAALRSLGVAQAKVETEPRTTDGKYDPAWIRHWE
ncbi:MAG: hypothetical protein IPN91_14640 [Holophagaceae bacterium]|uniref:Uncharacterized protein n=1 Tax=Candidatus Geothrix odensensis TaxID=2954440 RepID=A0A936K8S8_9BACT|nr:hypothetical protein [Candidatus Geothrix odensensis]